MKTSDKLHNFFIFWRKHIFSSGRWKVLFLAFRKFDWVTSSAKKQFLSIWQNESLIQTFERSISWKLQVPRKRNKFKNALKGFQDIDWRLWAMNFHFPHDVDSYYSQLKIFYI